MVEIYDEYESYLDGGHFSSPRKNLGNKLFIYATCRIISDLLDYDLISPSNALIRRENSETGTYEEIVFPFNSITGRTKVTNQIKVIQDGDMIALQSIENLIKNFPNHGFINQCYFSKYDYIKPYKNMVKEYFKTITKPKKNTNDLVIMLRSSNHDGSFVLPNSYYLNIISNETFDNLYIAFDHYNKHSDLINSLSQYNPKLIDGNIIDVFSELTSFNKIIAAQGTFSFWVCFLSDAEKIYWPLTNDGPNSGKNSDNPIYNTYVNLIVDDEDRYEFINVSNIYEK
jgi:hypothetical protein